LDDTEIFCSDFTRSGSYIKEGSFVYFDPPYRPLNSTSNFTAYSKNGFDDVDQIKLADFFERMDDKGAYLMMSNSDPKNENPHDKFFDRLYRSYKIDSVPAKRNINCDGSKRGNLNELIIMNYSLTS
jgi:DNA adenine methylase